MSYVNPDALPNVAQGGATVELARKILFWIADAIVKFVQALHANLWSML